MLLYEWCAKGIYSFYIIAICQVIVFMLPSMQPKDSCSISRMNGWKLVGLKLTQTVWNSFPSFLFVKKQFFFTCWPKGNFFFCASNNFAVRPSVCLSPHLSEIWDSHKHIILSTPGWLFAGFIDNYHCNQPNWFDFNHPEWTRSQQGQMPFSLIVFLAHK